MGPTRAFCGTGRGLASGRKERRAAAGTGDSRPVVSSAVPRSTLSTLPPVAGGHQGQNPLPEEFHRIKRLPPYVFAEVNRLKAAARARGADIIDLGMGNPDMPTPQHIVDKLIETIN